MAAANARGLNHCKQAQETRVMAFCTVSAERTVKCVRRFPLGLRQGSPAENRSTHQGAKVGLLAGAVIGRRGQSAAAAAFLTRR